jgi:hypothetical protein
MLIDEMHYELDQAVDRLSSQDRPDLLPEEKDSYLNKAIVRFTLDRYGMDNPKKSGFETSQERIGNLMNLHIKSPELQPELAPIDLGNGRYEIRLNNLDYRYLFLTAAKVKIRKDDCVKTIDHTQWQIDDRKTTFSDASFIWSRVLANFGKSTATPTINEEIPSLYFDTTDKTGVQVYTIDGVCLSYVKYPDRVCLGTYKHIDDKGPDPLTPITHCDIESIHHDEIIRIAAKLAFKDIQDQFGYQTSQVEINLDK